MLQIKFTKDEVTPFLNGVVKNIPIETSKLLDLLASDAKMMMGSIAPKGRSNKLSSEFGVDHSPKTRTITSTARNLDGSFYGSAVETGATGYSTLPNLSSIADYYSQPLFIEGDRFNPVVIAIARKIKEGRTAGARPRPFVERTVKWLNNIKIPQRCSDMLIKIVAK